MATRRLPARLGRSHRRRSGARRGAHHGRLARPGTRSRREADLAAAIDAGLDAGELPDLATMLPRFTPKATAAPEVLVILPPLAAYDRLIALAGAELVP